MAELYSVLDRLQPARSKAAHVERRDLCEQLRRELLPRQQTLFG